MLPAVGGKGRCSPVFIDEHLAGSTAQFCVGGVYTQPLMSLQESQPLSCWAFPAEPSEGRHLFHSSPQALPVQETPGLGRAHSAHSGDRCSLIY